MQIKKIFLSLLLVSFLSQAADSRVSEGKQEADVDTVHVAIDTVIMLEQEAASLRSIIQKTEGNVTDLLAQIQTIESQIKRMAPKGWQKLSQEMILEANSEDKKQKLINTLLRLHVPSNDRAADETELEIVSSSDGSINELSVGEHNPRIGLLTSGTDEDYYINNPQAGFVTPEAEDVTVESFSVSEFSIDDSDSESFSDFYLIDEDSTSSDSEKDNALTPLMNIFENASTQPRLHKLVRAKGPHGRRLPSRRK